MFLLFVVIFMLYVIVIQYTIHNIHVRYQAAVAVWVWDCGLLMFYVHVHTRCYMLNAERHGGVNYKAKFSVNVKYQVAHCQLQVAFIFFRW